MFIIILALIPILAIFLVVGICDRGKTMVFRIAVLEALIIAIIALPYHINHNRIKDLKDRIIPTEFSNIKYTVANYKNVKDRNKKEHIKPMIKKILKAKLKSLKKDIDEYNYLLTSNLKAKRDPMLSWLVPEIDWFPAPLHHIYFKAEIETWDVN